MYQFILIIHSIVALVLVFFVLLQQGKGAIAGAAFGSGASQTLFGSRGSGSFLFRLTLVFMSLFFLTSLSLNRMLAQSDQIKKGSAQDWPTEMAQKAPKLVPSFPISPKRGGDGVKKIHASPRQHSRIQNANPVVQTGEKQKSSILNQKNKVESHLDQRASTQMYSH